MFYVSQIHITSFYSIPLAAIQCSPLSAPTNGGVEYSAAGSPNFNFGTVGTYTCNVGFGIDGPRSRTCQGDGTTVTGFWSGSMASCDGKNML